MLGRFQNVNKKQKYAMHPLNYIPQNEEIETIVKSSPSEYHIIDIIQYTYSFDIYHYIYLIAHY